MSQDDKRTEQEKAPHKSLVEVRNAIEVAKECSRKEAAGIANKLTHKQCDLVVAADGDKGKIEQAIKPVVEKPEPAPEPKQPNKGK